MSSTVTRKSRKVTVPAEAVWNVKTVAALISILLGITLLIFAITKLRHAAVNSIPNEFEGRIVEKWAGFTETEEGSHPYFRLQVEIEGRRPFTVPVNRDIYEQAEVGMRLKRSDKGLELIREPDHMR